MTVPSVETSSVELMLLVGRAVFLVFSFILATIAFVRWRRTTLAQTEIVRPNGLYPCPWGIQPLSSSFKASKPSSSSKTDRNCKTQPNSSRPT